MVLGKLGLGEMGLGEMGQNLADSSRLIADLPPSGFSAMRVLHQAAQVTT